MDIEKDCTIDVYGFKNFTIERTGVESWAVRNGKHCLNKEFWFEYEPMPSSRSEEFLKNHRWKTPQEALDALEQSIINQK